MPFLATGIVRALGYSAVGWLLLAVLRTSVRLAIIPRPFDASILVLAQVLLGSLPWLFAAPAIVHAAANLRWDRAGRERALRMLAGGLAVMSVVEATWGWLVLPAAGYPMTLPPLVFYLVRLDQVVFLYIGLVGLGLGLRQRRRLDQAVAHTARLESQLLRARLHVLELQLHPHFLFNTLNAVSELVHRNAAAARAMLASLRELLARSLDPTAAQEITLSEELDLLEPYARIQRMRFEGSLTIATEADAVALEARLPRLVLQPLVENAIRHGTARRSGRGHIAVRAWTTDGKLVVEVEDDGAGISERSGREGVGLGNTRARLHQLYGDDARCVLRPGSLGGATARIECPLRSGPLPVASAEVEEDVTDPSIDTAVPGTRIALGLAAAWLIVGLAGGGQDYIAAWLAGSREQLGVTLLHRLLEAGLWLALAVPIVRASAALARAGLRWPALVLGHSVIGLAVVSIQTALVVELGGEALPPNVVATLLVNGLCVYAALAAGAHAWTVRAAAAARRAAAARLDADLAAARFDQLRWTIRPELLFGALDRVGALAADDVDSADELTGRLGELLRLMLQDRVAELVPVGRELELIAAYLEVEAAVRSEPADYRISVDAALGDARVPPRLLQPLVEALDGSRVSVTVRRGTVGLGIEIACEGGSASSEAVEMVRRRLRLLYGDRCSLTVDRRGNERIAALTLPAAVPEPALAVA